VFSRLHVSQSLVNNREHQTIRVALAVLGDTRAGVKSGLTGVRKRQVAVGGQTGPASPGTRPRPSKTVMLDRQVWLTMF
jgi:hypothetical protein